MIDEFNDAIDVTFDMLQYFGHSQLIEEMVGFEDRKIGAAPQFGMAETLAERGLMSEGGCGSHQVGQAFVYLDIAGKQQGARPMNPLRNFTKQVVGSAFQ